MVVDRQEMEERLNDVIYNFFRKDDTYYFDIRRYNPFGNQAIEVGRYGNSLVVNLHFHAASSNSLEYVDKELKEIDILPNKIEKRFIEYVFGPLKHRLEKF